VTHLLLLLLPLHLLLTSCVTASLPASRFGINPARTGFVPARIALVPCMTWPDRATKIKDLPLINRPKDELVNLCADFDKYVADGFDNQPFMKGLSQKLVEKLYTASGMTPAITDAITQEWRSLSADCQICPSLPALYVSSINPRTSWQLWLSKFTAATKGSDALMIPLVLSSNTRIEDNRGVHESIRSAAIAMLLIDTNDGSLIWSGGREAEVIYKALAANTKRESMKEPPFDDLKRRLFTEALWLEFPGRQIYR
jgi:hypothetical protein